MSKNKQLAVINEEQEGQSSEISVYDRMANPMEAVEAMGNMFAKSGMFGCQKPEQGQVLALACFTEKKSPFEIMKTYHIINGKLEMKAAAMVAKFIERGGKVKWTSKLVDKDKASAIFTTKDGDVYEEEYTIEDAKQEGLLSNANWKKAPADMLRARLSSKLIRMIDPMINSGVYDQMEMSSDELLAAAPRTALLPSQPVKKYDFATTAAEVSKEKEQVAVDPVSAPPEEPLQRAATTARPIQDSTGRDVLDRQLDNICMDEALSVNLFLTSKGLIKDGQDYLAVSDEVAQKIIENADAFIKQVKEEGK
jgi:hypothetical protein